MLKRIELGEVDRVVVYSIDRLTRKLFDLHKLLEMFDRFGVELAVVTDPNFGESAAHRLTTNIIAAASEFQLEMTRERMADSRAALKGKGRRVAGRVPFGYRVLRPAFGSAPVQVDGSSPISADLQLRCGGNYIFSIFVFTTGSLTTAPHRANARPIQSREDRISHCKAGGYGGEVNGDRVPLRRVVTSQHRDEQAQRDVHGDRHHYAEEKQQ